MAVPALQPGRSEPTYWQLRARRFRKIAASTSRQTALVLIGRAIFYEQIAAQLQNIDCESDLYRSPCSPSRSAVSQR
jgi:hypothetical protein